MWGTIKNEAYKRKLANREELKIQIRQAIALITPDKIRNLIQEVYKRIDRRIQKNDNHVEI